MGIFLSTWGACLCHLLIASHWSKWQLSVIIQSHNHTMSDGSKILVHVHNKYHVEFLRGIIHHLIDWTILLITKIHRGTQCKHMITYCVRRLLYRCSHSMLMGVVFPQSVIGIQTTWDYVESNMMRTCLASLIRARNTSKLIMIFLSNQYHLYLLFSFFKNTGSLYPPKQVA